ncbi:right-handed parallel beta-helix repeat-containing protein [Microbacterium sp.]|uniref:right-handed parallel beta-helix repeat-containing protein n=1 Tax=Microbacterium sp. TaxID=51671 RepID=UPI0033425954
MVNETRVQDVLRLRVSVSEDGGAGLRAAIRQATAWTGEDEARRAQVLLQPGVHRIDPVPGAADDEAAVTVENASRLTVSGPEAELLFTDPHCGGIDVRGGRGVVLEGFTIDYATPSFTQGMIVDVDPETCSFRFRPHSGYPDFTDRRLFTGTGYGTLREGEGGALKPDARQTFMISYDAAPDRDGTFRVIVDPGNRAWFPHIQPGDGFVVGHRGDLHGIRLDACERTVLRSLTIHAAPCAAILAHESSETLVDRVTVARRPGSSRWISTNADALHCQGGRRGPQIIGCRFEGMHDDGVNLYVHALRVVEARNARTLVLDGSGAVSDGDRLQLVDPARGVVIAEPTVSRLLSTAPLVVTLDREVPAILAGHEVYNRSNALPGFRIEKSTFHDFRGIGIRLKASEGIVADCRFERLSGCGLWIANDPGWSEGPLGSRDVDVIGNVFRACPGDVSLHAWPHSAATVMIEVFSGDDGPAESRPHERIHLQDNDIVQEAASAVFVGGASAVTIEDLRVDEKTGTPWLATRDSGVRVSEISGTAGSA